MLSKEDYMKRLCFTLMLFITVYLSGAEPDSLSVTSRKIYDIEGLKIIAESTKETIGSVRSKEYTPATIHSDLTVADALTDMSGLFLSIGGKGESNIRLRGFDKQHTRILIDGRPVTSGYFGNIDLHLLPISNIKQVDVIKGAASPLYGFNTMGGVINIITGASRRNFLKLKSQYTYRDAFHNSLSLYHKIGNTEGFLDGSYYTTKGFYLPQKTEPLNNNFIEEDGALRINSDRRQYDLNLRINTTLANLHTLSLSGGYSVMDKKGNPPSVYPNPDDRHSRIKDWQRYQLSLMGSFLINENNLSFNAYHDYYEDTYIAYNNKDYAKIIWESLIENNMYGLNLNAKFTLFSILENDFGSRIEHKIYGRTGGPGYTDIWVENDQTLASVYHQGSVKVGNLSATIGNSLNMHRREEVNSYYLEPRIGINYLMNEILLSPEFSVSYAYATQFPTMHQLFGSNSGNENLQPETAHKAELQVVNQLPFFQSELSTTLFYNRIDDLIDRTGNIYENQDRRSTFGTEFNLLYSPWQKLSGDFEISLTQLDKANSTFPLYDYPKVKLRLANEYRLTKNLFLNHSLLWNSSRTTIDKDNQIVVLPSYLINNTGLKYRFNFFDFTLQMNNLFDSYYEPQYGYPAPGRQIIAGIELSI